MNYPAASCGVSKDLYDNFPNVVTPECFYRGSRSGLAFGLPILLDAASWGGTRRVHRLRSDVASGRGSAPTTFAIIAVVVKWPMTPTTSARRL